MADSPQHNNVERRSARDLIMVAGFALSLAFIYTSGSLATRPPGP
uniref:Uncharacterized protein n=1 Tax=uncultured bacterium esnapd21 TaxID=1366603 RepID=S5TV65_9BACT|nr:hypothetical protein [uncultured bacterium esnapd21]